MQVLKGILITILSLWIAIIAFMPTQQIYFFLEKELAKNGIKINEDQIKNNIFGLDINGVDIYIEGIKLIHIDHIHFQTFLIWSKISMDNIKIDKSLSKVVPENISKIRLLHNIISPNIIDVNIKGDFGLAKGYIGTNHIIHLNLLDTKDISIFKSDLKRGDNGWYYETKL